MIFSENRYPPRIGCGAGFFGIMLYPRAGEPGFPWRQAGRLVEPTCRRIMKNPETDGAETPKMAPLHFRSGCIEPRELCAFRSMRRFRSRASSKTNLKCPECTRTGLAPYAGARQRSALQPCARAIAKRSNLRDQNRRAPAQVMMSAAPRHGGTESGKRPRAEPRRQA